MGTQLLSNTQKTTKAGRWSFAVFAWVFFLSLLFPRHLAAQTCANISGTWRYSETATVVCKAEALDESETETETTSGSGIVTLFQAPGECGFRYSAAGLTRTGTIDSNKITVSGVLGAPAAGAVITKNVFEGRGEVNGDVIHMSGSGVVEGSVTQEGILVRISCSLTSNASFSRMRIPTSISPTQYSLNSAGGNGSIRVTADIGTEWQARTNSDWITVTGGDSGRGNGTVTYAVSVNPGSARSGTLNVAGQTFTVNQSGNSSSETLFVPIVLSSSGANGSFFTSELTLTNRGPATATLQFNYTATFGDGSGTGTDQLLPGQQKVLPDAIAYLRSIGVPIPSSGNRAGTVAIRFTGLSSPSDAAATVRTTTTVPVGRAGLAYAAVPVAKALSGTAYVCGLRQNTTDRSNVAIQNAGSAWDGNIVLRVTLFSGDSNVSYRLPDQTLTPGEFRQFSGILDSAGGKITNGYVRVERISGRAPYYAYGVINDQANSDGSFVPPVADTALLASSSLTLPVVVETGTFSSELVLTNWSASPKTVRLSYLSEAVQKPDMTASYQLTLSPGRQIIIPRYVSFLRDLGLAGILPKGGSYVGSLFVSVIGSAARGVFAGARTAAPGGGGQYGLFYPAVGSSTSVSSAWLYGLQQDDEDRTNIALVNAAESSGAASTFRIEIFDGSSGAQVNVLEGIYLGPRRWTQFGMFLAQHAPGIRNAYVRITRTAGLAPFIAYAVVNDGARAGERTGDGAYVGMTVESQ